MKSDAHTQNVCDFMDEVLQVIQRTEPETAEILTGLATLLAMIYLDRCDNDLDLFLKKTKESYLQIKTMIDKKNET